MSQRSGTQPGGTARSDPVSSLVQPAVPCPGHARMGVTESPSFSFTTSLRTRFCLAGSPVLPAAPAVSYSPNVTVAQRSHWHIHLLLPSLLPSLSLFLPCTHSHCSCARSSPAQPSSTPPPHRHLQQIPVCNSCQLTRTSCPAHMHSPRTRLTNPFFNSAALLLTLQTSVRTRPEVLQVRFMAWAPTYIQPAQEDVHMHVYVSAE